MIWDLACVSTISQPLKPPDENSKPAWFALLVRPRHEQQAALALKGKQLEVFLPTYRLRKRWSDRKKEYDAPLFPRYIFCHFGRNQRRAVLETPSVQQVVGFGGQPYPVDEHELFALQSVERSGLPAAPHAFVDVGQRVRILDGPLSGLEGILMSLKGNDRMVLSVSLLRRSVAVEIKRDWGRGLNAIPAAAGQ